MTKSEYSFDSLFGGNGNRDKITTGFLPDNFNPKVKFTQTTT